MEWPWVSRSRYKRELRQLEEAYGVSTDDLRQRLMALIDQVTHVQRRGMMNGQREIAVRIFVPESEREEFIFAPSQRDEYWWHVAKKITADLKKEAGRGLYSFAGDSK